MCSVVALTTSLFLLSSLGILDPRALERYQEGCEGIKLHPIIQSFLIGFTGCIVFAIMFVIEARTILKHTEMPRLDLSP